MKIIALKNQLITIISSLQKVIFPPVPDLSPPLMMAKWGISCYLVLVYPKKKNLSHALLWIFMHSKIECGKKKYFFQMNQYYNSMYCRKVPIIPKLCFSKKWYQTECSIPTHNSKTVKLRKYIKSTIYPPPDRTTIHSAPWWAHVQMHS